MFNKKVSLNEKCDGLDGYLTKVNRFVVKKKGGGEGTEACKRIKLSKRVFFT